MRGKIGFFSLIMAFFVLSALPAAAATGTVSGKVVMPDGTSLASGLKVDVYLSSELAAIMRVGDPQNLEGGTDDTFSFTIDVPDDVYLFVIPAHSSDYAYVRSSVLQLTPDFPDYNAGDVQIKNTQLRGVVTDSNSQPLPNANVIFHNNDNSVTGFSQTDVDGYYNFGGAPVGTVLWMEASGPTDAYQYNTIERTFTAGSSIETYNIQANNATKQISGTVLFPDGTPVGTNTQIIILPTTVGRGWRQTLTDSTGHYSTAVTGGSWIVRPNFDRFNNSGWAFLEPPTQVTFSEDTSTEAATVNFTIQSAIGIIEGYALNADGSVPNMADVSLVLSNGAVVSTKVDASTGYFSVTVPAGVWMIKISPLPSRSATDSLFAPITATITDNERKNLGNIHGVNRSVTVTGRVIDNSGSAVSGASIDVYGPDLNYNYNSGSYSGIHTDVNGTFYFQVPPGYLIFTPQATGLGAYYKVKSNQAVNISSERTEFNIGDLVLEKLDGTINGNLGVDVDEGTGYAVDAEGKTYVSTSVADGQFSINIPVDKTVTVGFYSIPNSNYAVFDTETASNGQTVNLQATAVSANLSGEIKDESGNLVAEHIRVIATAQNAVYTTETTDGAYRLPMPAGEWQVNYEILEDQEVYLETSDSISLMINSSEQKTQDFTVPKADATVIGQVLDSANAALPFSDVYAFDGENLLLTETDASGNYSLPVKGGESYTIGTGDSPNTTDLSQNPTAVEPAVGSTVSNNITYVDPSAVVSGQVTLDSNIVSSGYVRVINSDGRFNSTKIDATGNYEIPVAKDDNIIVQAFYINNDKYYQSEAAELNTSNDENTQNLSLILDDSVSVPPLVKEDIADVTKTEIISVNDDLQLFIPPFALGTSGSAAVIVSPTIEVANQESSEPVNIGYELIAKDNNDVIIPNFNAPVTVDMKYQDEQITTNDLVEDNIAPRYNDPASDILAPILVATVDKDSNEVVFVTQHFSKYVLTATKTPSSATVERPTKVKKLKLVKKLAHKVKLSWKKQANIDRYQIKVMNKKAKKIKIVHSHKKHKIIKKLKSDHLYKFKVRAVRDDLKGKWSKVLKVRTKINK